MLFQNRKLNLFIFSILIVTIAVTLQSDDGETNPQLTECHWEASPASSKEKCMKRCLRYSGFWEKRSNKLICYLKEGPADVIEWTKTSCVCGYAFKRKNRPGIPCEPKMEFNIETSMFECQTICYKIKRYSYMSYKNVKISYCDDSINEAVSHRLEFWPNYYDERLENTHGYHCQCAVRSSLITESTREPEKADEIDSLKECQMGEFYTTRKDRCPLICDRAKGFIPQGSTELVCYHSTSPANVISLEKCQCGVILNLEGKPFLACVPEIIHTVTRADSDECKHICSNTTAFIFGRQYNSRELRLTRCQPFNHAPPSQSYYFPKLKPIIGLRRKSAPTLTSGGYERFEYSCSCGVGSLLPLDLNVKRNIYFSNPRKYDEHLQNNTSMPQNLPEVVAESSKSRSEKSGYSSDHRQNGTETRKMKEVLQNSPDSLRNNSLQEDSHLELVRWEDIVLTSPPVIPEIESFQIMDNFSDREKPVGDHVIPSICHDDTQMDNVFLNIPAYTSLFPNVNSRQPIVAPENNNPIYATFPTNKNDQSRDFISPSTSYLQYNHHHQTNKNDQPRDFISPSTSYLQYNHHHQTNKNDQPRDFISPLTSYLQYNHHHHQPYRNHDQHYRFHSEIGSLESVKNYNFKDGSSSQTFCDPDWLQMNNCFPNTPPYNVSMFPHVQLPQALDVPGNNNFSQMVLTTDRIILPSDFNPTSASQLRTESLHTTLNATVSLESLSNVMGGRKSLSNVIRRNVPLSNAMGSLESLSNGMGTQESLSNSMGINVTLLNSIGSNVTLLNAMGNNVPLLNVMGSLESLSNGMVKQDTPTNIMGIQESSTNIMGRQESSTNVMGRQETSTNIMGRQETSTNIMGRQESSTNIMGRQESSFNIMGRQELLPNAMGSHESIFNGMGKLPSVSSTFQEARKKRMKR